MPDPLPPTNNPLSQTSDNSRPHQPTASFGSGGGGGNCCGCRGCNCTQYNPPMAPPGMPPSFPAPPFSGGPGPNCLIYGGNCGCNCCGPAAPCCSGCIPCQPPHQGYFPGLSSLRRSHVCRVFSPRPHTAAVDCRRSSGHASDRRGPVSRISKSGSNRGCSAFCQGCATDRALP